MNKKQLKIKLKELTRSKFSMLGEFFEKGNVKVNAGDIAYNSHTKLASLWVNISKDFEGCWLPLDGNIFKDDFKRIEKVKVSGGSKGYKLILYLKYTGRTKNSRSVPVAPGSQERFMEKLEYEQLPVQIQKIKSKIARSRVYKFSGGRYAGCYTIKTTEYWSPPLFRASLDCGIYTGEGVLVGV